MTDDRFNFWKQVDTSPRFYRRCDCGNYKSHSFDCKFYTEWEAERQNQCLAQNGDGGRCSNLVGPGWPFCDRFHERSAMFAVKRYLVDDSKSHSFYGNLPDDVRALLVFIDSAQIFLDNDEKRLLLKHLDVSLPKPEVIYLKAGPKYTPEEPRRCSLYRHYDVDGILIYVGISVDPETRTKTHEVQSPWWRFVANSDLDWFDSQIDAATAERRAITDERPIFNKAGASPERDPRVVEYLIANKAFDLLRAAA